MSLYAWVGMELYSHNILGAALSVGCELFFYGSETQTVLTIAAGCPGEDLVRLSRNRNHQVTDFAHLSAVGLGLVKAD